MKRLSLILIAATALCVLTACGSSPTKPKQSPVASTPSMSGMSMSASAGATTTAPVKAGPASITIKNFAYTVPASVAPGTPIAVTNDDAIAHTVTLKSANIDVAVAGSGKATVTAPAKAGTYAITCDYHSNMHANLVVK